MGSIQLVLLQFDLFAQLIHLKLLLLKRGLLIV